MTLVIEERASDSTYLESIERVHAEADGTTVCPANGRWYMLVTTHNNKQQMSVVGPLTKATPTTYVEGTEFLFVKFSLGAFMPKFPAKSLVDTEITLLQARHSTFWLDSSTWQFPDYDNIETFVDKLAREELLVIDSVVDTILQDRQPQLAVRTIRHRFMQATGLNQSYIRQIERARHAQAILQQGTPILDAVYEAGYYDQPHLTRSLKQFIGYTPVQIAQMGQLD